MSDKCPEVAAYRFTWPGQDESFICEGHVGKLRSVAAAMGMHLQVIELEPDSLVKLACSQKVRVEKLTGACTAETDGD